MQRITFFTKISQKRKPYTGKGDVMSRSFQDRIDEIHRKNNILAYIEESLLCKGPEDGASFSDKALWGLAELVGDFKEDVEALHNHYYDEKSKSNHKPSIHAATPANSATQ